MSNRNSILLLAILTINNVAIAALNDTGVKTCSNATQNGLPCPVAGFPGQDAEYGTNSFDFTKLDANGNAMSVAATNHSCVQDNVTGLMWEVATHEANFDNAASFATQANAANLCGHNDWRVPNPHELDSIVDYSVYDPSIDEGFFPNTPSYYFWTNSPYLYYPSTESWIVNFNYGGVSSSSRNNNLFVRCVRAGQWLFPFSFTDQGDGTITEQNTGLMWAKCSVGQGATDCSGSASNLTWQQALQAADNSTLAGYTDWRLTNVKELQTLVDYTKYNPAINSTYFPNISVNNWFWTSSPYKNCVSCSWIVAFASGGVSYNSRNVNHFVRCVRAGQWLLPFSLNVAKAGNGAGSVSSNPAGINCGGSTGSPNDCSENYASGTAVTLTATPAAGSAFGGWGGDADCNDGTVTMDAAKNCTATFNLDIKPPAVSTDSPSLITTTSAILKGTVNPRGAATTVNFDFGTTTVYSQNLAATPSPIAATAAATSVSANKTGLTCGTTYHFRTKATNSAGTSYGTDKSFTTTACPPINGSFVITPSVIANGTVTPGTPQTVAAGTLKTFTVTPSIGYIKDFVVGGTCPQGSWNENNRWTTGPINANCSVIFNFTAQPTAWLSPTNPYTTANSKLTLGLHVDSWGVKLNTYDFDVNFDPSKLRADLTFQDESKTCRSGVCRGANATTNWNANVDYVNGKMTLTGSDIQGIGPGNSLELVKIHFLPTPNPVITSVNLTLNRLLTEGLSDNIGNGLTGNSLVTIQRYKCGDANGDTFINIIDALSIARQVIGLPPPPSITPVADVNINGEISIVDAMHIARYSLGLVVVGTCLM